MENEIVKGKLILLVEDDLSSRIYLNKILERAGALLLNAGDGEEAISIANNNPDIDVILMDIQLPLLDGYNSADRIRALGRNVIIIAQTAYGLIGEQEKIMAAGFDDYIIKPIIAGTLIDKIAACIISKNKIKKID